MEDSYKCKTTTSSIRSPYFPQPYYFPVMASRFSVLEFDIAVLYEVSTWNFRVTPRVLKWRIQSSLDINPD